MYFQYLQYYALSESKRKVKKEKQHIFTGTYDV